MFGAMPLAETRAVIELAKRQEGVVSYEQLVALGVTDDGRYHRLRTGEWVRMLPSVLRMHWAEETWLSRVWAAGLWVSSTAFLSHWTAAALHGLGSPDGETVDVTGVGLRLGEVPWLRQHSILEVPAEELEEVMGLRVASPTLTLVQLAAQLSEEELRHLILIGEQQRIVSLPKLRNALPKLARRGKPGGGRLRRAVESISSRADRP